MKTALFILVAAVSACAFNISFAWDPVLGATGFRLVASNGDEVVESACNGTNGHLFGLGAGRWSIHVVTESNGVEIGQSDTIAITIGNFPCVIGR